MPGKSGFDFNGASRSFNVLAEYHFGKVVIYFRIEPHSCILKFYWVAFDHCPFLFSPSILREEKSYRCVLLFCWQNTTKEKMEMNTPVFTSKNQSDGVKMDMTTPVLTTKVL